MDEALNRISERLVFDNGLTGEEGEWGFAESALEETERYLEEGSPVDPEGWMVRGQLIELAGTAKMEKELRRRVQIIVAPDWD